MFLPFGSAENQGHYFFKERKVGARNFVLRDWTLVCFGARRREDNHRVGQKGLEGVLEPSF